MGAVAQSPTGVMTTRCSEMDRQQMGNQDLNELCDALPLRVYEQVPMAMIDGITEGDLWRALTEERLEVRYQPIVRLIGTARGAPHPVIGAEALLRWRHPELGLLRPEQFFVAFENDPELMRAVETHVLLVATRAAAKAGLEVAVNLSPVRFSEGDELILSVSRALLRSSLDPAGLTLEITEREFPRDLEAVVVGVKQLQILGVQVIADDFGTGNSSIYLKNLSLDGIKLDRVFIRAAENGEWRETVAEIVDVAHKLALTVLAEGVETRRQAILARALGVDWAQGYFYGRPGPSMPTPRD